MRSKKIKLLFVLGTRPEALKLAPVILKARSDKRFQPVVCLTAQHRQMVDQVMHFFKIKPDYDLDLMQKDQTLLSLTQRLLPEIQKVIHEVRPDLLLVQGDTTTAFGVALQAFYEKVSVGHVEAGLRSFDKYQPFPEEINRVLISHLGDFHFAPTSEARHNLLKEGVQAARVFVTGNTVVDALQTTRHMLGSKSTQNKKKLVLVTAHRRESFGAPLREICKALKDIVKLGPEIEIIYPVHLNPKVQKIVFQELRGQKQIKLIDPLSYPDFVRLMDQAYLILTDSGGVQEEAPTFKKPVLVMREVTERPDGITLGVARLVGTSRKKIYQEAKRLLTDPKAYRSMIKNKNPYGDGKASERILDIIARRFKK